MHSHTHQRLAKCSTGCLLEHVARMSAPESPHWMFGPGRIRMHQQARAWLRLLGQGRWHQRCLSPPRRRVHDCSLSLPFTMGRKVVRPGSTNESLVGAAALLCVTVFLVILCLLDAAVISAPGPASNYP